MKRVNMIAAIDEPSQVWDVIVIGGGATGLGAALESASRGHRTLLLESHDFAKGTSSRSTKLIHGGVRYLRQGQVGMVRQSLRERLRLFRNAAHLVHPLEFVMPSYSWGKREFYYVGLRLYDLLAGNFWSGRARWLTSSEVRKELPALQDVGLKGGVKYVDGQFDDSRLAISLARTAVNHDAIVVNYMKVVRLQCQAGKIRSVVVRDALTGRECTVSGRAVINATGVFADELLDLEVGSNADHNNKAAIDANRPTVRPSQGSHVVLDAAFLPGAKALMIPETDDGRVLFAIPWHGKVLLGTTDTEVKSIAVEPRPLSSEIDYLLDYGGRYLGRAPAQFDIRSCFSGLRPLVARKSATAATSRLSREHEIYVGPTGMITVIGGKWTTYRHMGEELINHAESIGSLPRRKSVTSELSLHGNWPVESQTLNHPTSVEAEHLSVYGTDSQEIASLSFENQKTRSSNPTDRSDEKLHARLPYLVGEVLWSARYEMAMTVEDVLARRTRALFLDAQAAVEAAPRVAALLRAEFGQTADWEKAQVSEFHALAAGYFAGNSEARLPSNNT